MCVVCQSVASLAMVREWHSSYCQFSCIVYPKYVILNLLGADAACYNSIQLGLA